MVRAKYLIFFFGLMLLNTFAQFGQNKVQYKDFDWYFIKTEHFDIYFTGQGKEIAEFTSHAAEDALAAICKNLDYTLNNRISLVVYNSHNDFQETNTTNSYLSQGVGGFTEPFKNRVIFPFEGSYKKFRHVIHHELVHAVMRDMLYGGTIQNIIARNITLQLPHWYHEGMAEYLSTGWETNTDMFIRDAIMHENLPDINRLTGYYGYRGGQSVMAYIARTYGLEKLGEILHKTQQTGSLEGGLQASIGLKLDELNERWKKYYKKEYWPEIGYRKDPEEIAKRLTDNEESGGFYNTSPALSPQGDKIAFISDRDIYLNIYLMDATTGKIIKKVAESGRAQNFEELNILFPSLTWSPDNITIALSLKSKGYDRIYTIDTEDNRFVELPVKMDGIESVSWSPDGDKIAFVGSNSSCSDIYVYNLKTKELFNLTSDLFSDSDPKWAPDSKTIYFSSDRGKYISHAQLDENFKIYEHDYRQLDLYAINSETLGIQRITDWELSDEKSVVFSPDGKEILFVSDHNGIDNIYKMRLASANDDSLNTIVGLEAEPLTNSLNGLNELSLSADGKKLVFTTLYKGGYNIFSLTNPFDMKPVDSLQNTDYMNVLMKSENKNHDPFLENDEPDSMSQSIAAVDDTMSSFREIDSLASEYDSTQIFTGSYVQEDTTTIQSSKDYSRYVFGEASYIAPDTSKEKVNREQMFSKSLDDEGNYLVNKYKIDFSPDLIYANAGYSSLYGLLGTTVLSFSDILGNHQIIGVTSLQIDLKNSDYGLAYYYLAHRTNYGIEGFHTARFVYLNGSLGSELYRFRNFGGVASISYPLNRFYRVDGSLSVMGVSSENLDDYTQPIESSSFVVPSISFVHDNVMWGYTSPIQGTRYKITAFGNPGFTGFRKTFFSFTWDFRRYYRFWYDNHFAIRLSGGYSGGGNPQRFFIGGTESWINREFATGEVPLDSPEDFIFLTPAMPLRGYDYAEEIGTKYSLLNLELRMPLIRYLVTGPLPILFQNILGTAFIDAGSAWDNTEKLQFIGKDSEGHTVTNDLLVGTGFGVRMAFLFLWRMDVAWQYDIHSFSEPRYMFSIGYDW